MQSSPSQSLQLQQRRAQPNAGNAARPLPANKCVGPNWLGPVGAARAGAAHIGY